MLQYLFNFHLKLLKPKIIVTLSPPFFWVSLVFSFFSSKTEIVVKNLVYLMHLFTYINPLFIYVIYWVLRSKEFYKSRMFICSFTWCLIFLFGLILVKCLFLFSYQTFVSTRSIKYLFIFNFTLYKVNTPFLLFQIVYIITTSISFCLWWYVMTP